MRWVVLVLAGCAAQSPAKRSPQSTPLQTAPPSIDHANAAIDALVANDWSAVVADFDLDSAPPTPSQVEAAWREQAGGLGEPLTWTRVDRTYQDGLEVRIIHVELERGIVQCLLSVDLDSLELRSLFITRPAPPPTYIDHDRFREVEVRVGSAPYVLGGTLTLPRGNGPFPAVLLVHGSGPNDRDASVGATKIVREQMRYLGAPREVLVQTRDRSDRALTGRRARVPARHAVLVLARLGDRDGIAMVKRFARPTLVMHGTRDYQVSSGDFAAWQAGLAKEPYAELVTLDGLNHLFIAGHGAPSPLEYKVENHVDPRVLAKLSAFVRAAEGIRGSRPARTSTRPRRRSYG